MPYLLLSDVTAIWGFQPKVSNTQLAITTSKSEVAEGTPVLITDVAKPASPQIIKTISAPNMPTFTYTPSNALYSITLWLSGKNTAGVDRTLNYEIDKNNVSALTGNLVINTVKYWSITAFIKDVVLGDHFDIYLWASLTGVINYDYHAYSVQVHQILPVDSRLCLSSVFTSANITLASCPRTITWTDTGAFDIYNAAVYKYLSAVQEGQVINLWMKTKTVAITSIIESQIVQDAANCLFKRYKLMSEINHVIL